MALARARHREAPGAPHAVRAMPRAGHQERVMHDMATWLQFDRASWHLDVRWPGAAARFTGVDRLGLALEAGMPAVVAPWAAAFGVLLARGAASSAQLATALRDGALTPLALADAALVAAGGDIARALTMLERHWLDHVRAVGRSARRAVVLLEPGDAVWLVPDDGAMLAAVLAVGDGLALRLTLAPVAADMPWLVAVARAGGHAIIADAGDAVLTLSEAQWVDRAGTAWCRAAPGSAPWPVYALSATGPLADAPARRGASEPCVVAAIITPRGIYRPPMIGRHDDDRELPHELIPLH
jgi:hypothetical protein